MSYEDDNTSGSDQDFGDLFGSEDEASDIDDGRSQTSEDQQKSPVASAIKTSAPTTSNSKSNNDLDNLFGSEDESESEEEQQPEKRQTLKQRSRIESSDEDIDYNKKSAQGYNDDIEDEDREDYEQYSSQTSRKERIEVSLEMPQLPIPYSDNNKYSLAKLPRFLDIEASPFVPDEFEIQIEEGLTPAQEQETIREQIESTIRWRRTKKNNKEIMQSNAHLVEWEDGKMSLILGEECFDISNKHVGANEHAYLLAHQTDSGALESQVEFTDSMTFRPSGLKSDTHRHLTAQIANKQVKKNKTKMYYTDKDPELMKQELETKENERLKAQKKLEMARRKTDIRYADVPSRRNNDFGDYDTMDYPSQRYDGAGDSSRAQDHYEDDFVVDDDEYDEEEERSRENRLSQVKRSGMDKYKRARYSDNEEEEEEEEEDAEYGNDEEEEEEEEIVVRKHKKNRILSDEDE